MELTNLNAVQRTKLGTRDSARARREGRLPAVLFGHQQDSVHLTVDAAEFKTALRHHSRVFDLSVDGKAEQALLAEVQYDAFGDEPIHADFRRIDPDERVTVVVDIEFVGHAKGTSKGGRFVHNLTELAVECKPSSIPEKITVRVGDLDIDDSIRVSDLDLPEGITAQIDGATSVCSVQAPGGGGGAEGEEGAEEGGGEAAEPEVIGKGGGDE